jgi:hypothetical protein
MWLWASQNAGTISAIAAAIAAIATGAIAVLTMASVRKLHQTTTAQVLLDLTARYQAREMLDAMDALRDWEREHGADFAKKFEDAFVHRDERAVELNRHRRVVTHYFHNVIMLYRMGVIDDRAIRAIIFPFQVDFLLDVVEPIERTRVGYRDIRYMFDSYRQLYAAKPYLPSDRRFWPFSRA